MKADIALSTANLVSFLLPSFFVRSRLNLMLLLLVLPVWTCVMVMMQCSFGICDDNVNPRSRPINVVLLMNEMIFQQINTETLLTEFAEYQDLRISYKVTPNPISNSTERTQTDDETQMWNEAMSGLKTTDTDAIVWISGDDTIFIYLFTLRGDQFVRKRVIENGATFNFESISAILRGWFDVLPAMDKPPSSKPALPTQSAPTPRPTPTPTPTSTPSPATPSPSAQLNVRITSGKVYEIQPATARPAILQVEGAAIATYASQWLFGGQMAMAVTIHCRYALFVSGGVYNSLKTTYQNIKFELHKYPINLGIRRLWLFNSIQLGAAAGVETEVYRRKLFDQKWRGKTGFQPSLFATGRVAWNYNRRFQIFAEFGLRLVVREPVFDIIVHSATLNAALTNKDSDEIRRVVIYDAYIVQPIVNMGITLKF